MTTSISTVWKKALPICLDWLCACPTAISAWEGTGLSASSPAEPEILPWRCTTPTVPGGAMCGNGIRCVGKYVYDKGLTRKRCLTIDTDAGPRRLELTVSAGRAVWVRVDMGKAAVGEEVELEAEGERFRVVPVNVGNPHGVIFCPDLERVELEWLGPQLEQNPALPERINVEFVTVEDAETLGVRVWERGSGITLACGTGACAAFAAAWKRGLCESRACVRLPGGELRMEREDGTLFFGRTRPHRL